jgi:hypothetical protein
MNRDEEREVYVITLDGVRRVLDPEAWQRALEEQIQAEDPARWERIQRELRRRQQQED